MTETLTDAAPVPETIGELVERAACRAAETFANNDPIATKRTTPDALHDARVALRRLRSILRTFRTVFDPGWASSVRSELGWFGGLLGAVRQVDIFSEHLGAYDEWDQDSETANVISRHLAIDRARCMGELIACAESDRYTAMIAFLDSLRSAPPVSGKADDATSLVLAQKLKRPWRDLRDASRRAMHTKDEADLHAMRIRAKELRYASEMASTVLGPELKRVAKAASAIQDRLGDHRDAIFTANYLQGLAQSDQGVGYLAGQLVVHEQFLANTTLSDLSGDVRRLKKRWKQVHRNQR